MGNTIGSNLLRYLGLIGNSGLHTGTLVPRPRTPDSEQLLWRDFQDGGNIADEMAEWDLMKAALVEIVDEATQVDANSPATVWYQCNDRKFEEELNNMLLRIDSEKELPGQVWSVASLGNNFDKL